MLCFLIDWWFSTVCLVIRNGTIFRERDCDVPLPVWCRYARDIIALHYERLPVGNVRTLWIAICKTSK
jgi:hypothetical protein